MKWWVLYSNFIIEYIFFLSNFRGGGWRQGLDTRLVLYCNNNSIIYLKFNIQIRNTKYEILYLDINITILE